MAKILYISLIGYLTALIGFLGGTIFVFIAKKFGRKIHGIALSFTAGLLISFICFEMLPIAFETKGVGVGIIGILLGMAVSTIIENKISGLSFSAEKDSSGYLKTGFLLCLGIIIHKIPEGIVVGSLLSYNTSLGLSMAVIICIHCFPEAIAAIFPLAAGGMKVRKIISGCFLMALPMALGALIGGLITNVSSMFVALSLAFSGGIMIYITCGEIIPESKDILKNSLSAVTAVFGFVVGILMIY